MTTALLLSGGVDSTAIAALTIPEVALTIDYGQRPARAEIAAAAAVARHLGITHVTLHLDLSAVGAGLLVGAGPHNGPTPEWFPFRNQFLATAGAAYAVTHGITEVLLGTVGGDGARHADGTPAFVDAIDHATRLQEGAVRIRAPFIEDDPAALIGRCGLPESVLRRTFSCHTGELACGQCPGCNRRRDLFAAQPGWTN